MFCVSSHRGAPPLGWEYSAKVTPVIVVSGLPLISFSVPLNFTRRGSRAAAIVTEPLAGLAFCCEKTEVEQTHPRTAPHIAHLRLVFIANLPSVDFDLCCDPQAGRPSFRRGPDCRNPARLTMARAWRFADFFVTS